MGSCIFIFYLCWMQFFFFFSPFEMTLIIQLRSSFCLMRALTWQFLCTVASFIDLIFFWGLEFKGILFLLRISQRICILYAIYTDEGCNISDVKVWTYIYDFWQPLNQIKRAKLCRQHSYLLTKNWKKKHNILSDS